jgi:DNA mismatch endonuclease Vsr
MDRITKSRRSANMSRIRSRDTEAEMALRRALWRAGVRGYRVHPRGVVGKPDIAFLGKRVAVFVDGCFWHACPACFVAPASNTDYWEPKIAGNQQRDADVSATLTTQGWTVVRVWEHEVKRNPSDAVGRVRDALV